MTITKQELVNVIEYATRMIQNHSTCLSVLSATKEELTIFQEKDGFGGFTQPHMKDLYNLFDSVLLLLDKSIEQAIQVEANDFNLHYFRLLGNLSQLSGVESLKTMLNILADEYVLERQVWLDKHGEEHINQASFQTVTELFGKVFIDVQWSKQ